MIYMGCQALVGIFAVEYAFSKTKRFRKVDEERDGKFPAFRRKDVNKWARWKFYPGAMLVMPIRCVLLALIVILLVLLVSIFSIGHDFKKGPMKSGCRKRVIKHIYTIGCGLYLLISGVTTQKK